MLRQLPFITKGGAGRRHRLERLPVWPVLLIIILAPALPFAAMAQALAECRFIAFESDAGGEPLACGTMIADRVHNYQPYGLWGVTFDWSAHVHRGGEPGPLMLFDTSYPQGCRGHAATEHKHIDYDLGSPNRHCGIGGPGRSKPKMDGVLGGNCFEPQGRLQRGEFLRNVLILSQDGDPVQPNDNARGGVITIIFSFDVTLRQLWLLDGIDDDRGKTTLFDAGGRVLGTLKYAGPRHNTHENGFYPYDLEALKVAAPGSDFGIGASFEGENSGVRKVEVDLGFHSGGIAAFKYCTEDTPEQITDTRFSPGEQPVAQEQMSLSSSAQPVEEEQRSFSRGR